MMLVSNLMRRIVAELNRKINHYNCLITLRRVCEEYLKRDLKPRFKEFWQRTYNDVLKEIDAQIDEIKEYLDSLKNNK